MKGYTAEDKKSLMIEREMRAAIAEATMGVMNTALKHSLKPSALMAAMAGIMFTTESVPKSEGLSTVGYFMDWSEGEIPENQRIHWNHGKDGNYAERKG